MTETPIWLFHQAGDAIGANDQRAFSSFIGSARYFLWTPAPVAIWYLLHKQGQIKAVAVIFIGANIIPSNAIMIPIDISRVVALVLTGITTRGTGIECRGRNRTVR
jgi:hypothetical protein